MAGHDAGVRVTCAGCSRVVLQKAMIPLLGDGDEGLRYLCATCARAFVVGPPAVGPAAAGPAAADSGGAAAEPGEPADPLEQRS